MFCVYEITIPVKGKTVNQSVLPCFLMETTSSDSAQKFRQLISHDSVCPLVGMQITVAGASGEIIGLHIAAQPLSIPETAPVIDIHGVNVRNSVLLAKGNQSIPHGIFQCFAGYNRQNHTDVHIRICFGIVGKHGIPCTAPGSGVRTVHIAHKSCVPVLQAVARCLLIFRAICIIGRIIFLAVHIFRLVTP